MPTIEEIERDARATEFQLESSADPSVLKQICETATAESRRFGHHKVVEVEPFGPADGEVSYFYGVKAGGFFVASFTVSSTEIKDGRYSIRFSVEDEYEVYQPTLLGIIPAGKRVATGLSALERFSAVLRRELTQ